MNLTNFRDLGGYETTDGRHVKCGLFYRSSPIIFQNDADRKSFSDLHIKTILDLRSSQEAEGNPDETINECNYIHCSALPLTAENEGNLDIAELIQKEEVCLLTRYVEEMYRLLPFQNEAYRILFQLMREDKVPFVFHCSAGKDRTGFATYLILKTLGVPDETILHDYMLSNVYRKEENEKILAHYGHLKGAEELLCVKEKYLQSSIDAILQKYDDFETYVQEEYNVTKEDILTFREKYLS